MAIAITHDWLCERALGWLTGNQKCAVAACNLSGNGPEYPDCIGWTTAGLSILLEIKMSRSDFLADFGKWHRKAANEGTRKAIGALRYYVAAPGIVWDTDDLGSWGLLEYRSNLFVTKRKPTRLKDVAHRDEASLLVRFARIAHLNTRYRSGRCVVTTRDWPVATIEEDEDGQPIVAPVLDADPLGKAERLIAPAVSSEDLFA